MPVMKQGIPVIVGESVAGRAASVRRDLLLLSSSINRSIFDFGDLLYEVRENNYFSAWGFSSLAEYAQQELGIKQRKSEYLVRIVRTMKAVGLKREQFEPAGTSKLREICTLNPEASFWNADIKVSEQLSDHIVRLVLDADEMTGEQVHEEILRLTGRLGPDRPITRSYTVSQACYDGVVKPAFELIRMRLGSAGRDADGVAVEYTDGAVLECLCAEALSDPTNQPEPIDTEDDVPATIEIPTEGA